MPNTRFQYDEDRPSFGTLFGLAERRQRPGSRIEGNNALTASCHAHTDEDAAARVADEDEETARRFGWWPKRSTACRR
jgi:hypothetical protein